MKGNEMSDLGKPVALSFAATVMKAANAGEKGGALVAIFGGLTATEFAAIGGLAIAFLGFLTNAVMNWYFKSQHLKLAREKAKAGIVESKEGAGDE
jgi:Bacteriophage holin family, superfamily II-like